MIFTITEETKDTSILFINELMGLFLIHEQKTNKSSDETLEHFL